MRTILFILILAIPPVAATQPMKDPRVIELPAPRTETGTPVERALHQRRSERRFADRPLELADVAQLLWSAQGITSRDGLRTAPSAGALYPLELYVVSGRVTDLPSGVWHYRPDRHHLVQLSATDVRSSLARAALDQAWVREAAAVVVFTAVFERTMRKYGKRGPRYVHIEAGHAAQNLFLQAVSLDLRTVVVGAFRDAAVTRALDLPEDHAPLLIMPVGH